MEISFKNKRALVTGASQGIGRDIAKRLTICGAEVIAVSRSTQLLASLAQEILSIKTLSVDLSDWTATEKALSNIGPIDLPVNNAGVVVLEQLTEVSEKSVDQSFGINAKALINVTKIVAQNLLARKAPGSIVNVSSQASLAGLLDHAVYCSTKGAVDAFTRASALEFGPHNIRVNSVNPTVIMTARGKSGWSDPAKAVLMLQRIPLRRFGEVKEVVDAVLYLLSDRSSMITGTCLPVDGGFLAS